MVNVRLVGGPAANRVYRVERPDDGEELYVETEEGALAYRTTSLTAPDGCMLAIYVEPVDHATLARIAERADVGERVE